ncbi:septum formation initiator family protein [Streptomyces sp. NPDC093568]|uniref:septum formation initiator family protein n=1 Tax=Streptomyces sp. NPDC093568 TaxID=3366041 RepID=UPI0038056653
MSRKPELRGRAARLARLFPPGAAQAARAPFVLLVVLLLGGGLIGLLVLNSALSEGAFKLDDIQRETKSLTDEEQSLQRDIDAYSAPDALQRRARELGMVPGGDPAFLNPDGTVKGVPSAAPSAQTGGLSPLVVAPEALAGDPATPVTSGSSTTPAGATPEPATPEGAPQYVPAQQPTASAPSAQSSTYPTPGR